MEPSKLILHGASLAAKHLDPLLASSLSLLKTRWGTGLSDLVRSALAYPESSIGVYAGDAESYEVFQDYLLPIVKEYHKVNKLGLQTTDWDAGRLSPLPGVVRSTRIRVARNLAGFPFGSMLNKEQRSSAEQLIRSALLKLTGDLKGEYISLGDLSEVEATQLREEHLLFQKGDKYLEAAGLNQDWPDGRGIFLSQDRRFVVWVNEEDMLRIISIEQGANLPKVYARLSHAVNQLSQELDFAFHQKLGWLSSCPSNLGTAMRASVHIQLASLAKSTQVFESLSKRYRLQVRGTGGEHTASVNHYYDISNRERLGLNEQECVHLLARGVAALVDADQGAKC